MMIHTPTSFFRMCEKFAKDSGICKLRKGKTRILEYWNTAKERRNMKTSPHKAAIFFFAFRGSYYTSELE